jgi:hypothetical protein
LSNKNIAGSANIENSISFIPVVNIGVNGPERRKTFAIMMAL